MKNYTLTSTAGLGEVLQTPFDVFITSASYEPRCFSVARNLPSNRYSIALVAGNRNHRDYIGPNWDSLCRTLRGQIVMVEQDTNNPIVGADSFARAFETIRAQAGLSLLIDITTFTREALVVLLGLLRQVVGPAGRVVCAYNSAKSYGRETGPIWLSRGVREIRSILGFPGDVSPARRNHLIVVFGYEVERAAGLIAAYEPNVLSIGVPSEEESLSRQVFETQQLFLKQLQLLYPSEKLRLFEASAKDPVVTKEAVVRQMNEYAGLNTILAPFNTKPSVVGACLAALEHPEIQMCYAQPTAYNTLSYAVPSDDIYLFELQIGTNAVTAAIGKSLPVSPGTYIQRSVRPDEAM